MTPYSTFAQNTRIATPSAPSNEVSLSLMISISALRLVNRVERSIANMRRR